MSDIALSVLQTRYSLIGFFRNPRAVVFTIIMPLFLLVILNTIFHNLTTFVGAKTTALYYTPAMVGYQIIWAGLSSLNATIVADREAGLLKRFRGTPMPRWVYLASEIARTIVVVCCTVLILVLVGVVFYRVRLSPDAVVGLVVYTVLGAAVMASLGLALTRVSSTTDTAAVIGPFLVVILSFISGVFVPMNLMPAWLFDVGKAFPLEHLAGGLRTAFTMKDSSGLSAGNVGMLAIWGLAGVLVAIRTFRWEPIGRR
jgi:ABC-2 type transport system permease protein